MRLTKILSVIIGLMCCLLAAAQFNPANPPEPGAPEVSYQLTVLSSPEGAGSVTSSAKQKAGSSVWLSASPRSGYTFLRWEENGSVISTSSSFYYTMPEHATTVVACFEYNPSNPSEPSQPDRYATVSVGASPANAGSVSGAGRYAVGSQQYVSTSARTSYRFVNWTIGDEVISTSTSFYYTVRESGNNLVANYVYDPTNPSEPTQPAVTRTLTLKVSPSSAGYTNPSSGGRYAPGTSVTVTAYEYSNYQFISWTDASGEQISDSRLFTYIMPDTDTELIARYRYNPGSPGEPGATAPRRNVIYGGRMSVSPGAEIFYDINLENIDPVTGINVDLAVPSSLTADPERAVTTNRTSGHIYSYEEVNDTTYRIRIRGTEPIAGASGAVARIPLRIPADSEYGTIITMPMTRGVVVSADGTQTSVDAVDGIIKIEDSPSLPDSPDFIVTDVACVDTSVMPGEPLSVSWKVKNQGTIPASGGWNETVSIVNESNKRLSLATVYYDTQEMAVGETVERNAVVAIPELPGIEGPLDVRIDLTPYASSGEIDELQINNIGSTTGRPLTLGKRLVLELPESLDEGSNATARLSRSGNWTDSETFDLVKIRGDDRLQIPASVTIPRDQSGTYFVISAADNDVVDADMNFAVSAEGNGYAAVEGTLVIVDDEDPELDLLFAREQITEGETVDLTISIPNPVAEDVTVSLTCDLPGRFKFPSAVTIAAGLTSAQAQVQALDDDVPDVEQLVAFTATAPGYESTMALLTLVDNDIPSLLLELVPDEVSEGDGPLAVTARIVRTDNIDKAVTIKLSDDSDGNIYYSTRSVEMAKGVESVSVSLGPVDNSIVDGDRVYHISAAVFIPSCSCNLSDGKSGGVVTQTLTVLDNDGPTLKMTAPSTVLNEGAQMEVTLERNTDVAAALQVDITSTYDEGLEYPSTVTIPAGSSVVTFIVKSIVNDLVAEDVSVKLTASAEGFAKANLWFTVSDRSLPDAVITSISSGDDPVYAGEVINVAVTVSNKGNALLPASVPVKVFGYSRNEHVATVYSPESIPAGGSITVTVPVDAPASIGDYMLYATVNDTKVTPELDYSNNTSAVYTVKVRPPFEAETSVDKTLYDAGEEVTVRGRVSGRYEQGAEVDVYVINQGSRQSLKAIVNADGTFETVYTPLALQSGHFAVGACYPGVNSRDEQCGFDIYGIQIANTEAITCDPLKNETYRGIIRVANRGSLPLTGVKAVLKNDPEDCKISLPNSGLTLAGGEERDIEFTLTGSQATQGLAWKAVDVELVADQNVSVQTRIYYYIQEPQGRLKTDISSLNTSITIGRPRTYSFELSNTGKGETGKITLALPSWMSAASPMPINSLASGESTTVMLRLEASDAMQPNIPVSGHIGVNCESGIGLALPFNIEPVSELTGKLEVDVCDEYTYYTAEAPHVAGASVKVTHPTNGTLVAEGTTDAQGRFDVELPEGYYRLSVTADRHESYANNIYVDPGRTTELTVNIGYSAISYDFVVEETEIEDEYTIVTKVVYETNVPMPVVVLDIPEKIDGDNMRAGDSTIVYFTATNKGLLSALNSTWKLPEDTEEWKFEPLDDVAPFELPSQQSVSLPVRITRLIDESMDAPRDSRRRANNIVEYFGNCMVVAALDYEGLCGDEIKNNESMERMAMKMCGLAAAGATVFDALGWLGRFAITPKFHDPGPVPGSPVNPHYTEKETNNGGVATGQQFNMCDPCDAARGEEILNVMIGKVFISNVNDAMDIAYSASKDQRDGKEKHEIRQMTRKAFEKLLEFIAKQKFGENKVEAVGWVTDYAKVIGALDKECPESDDNGGSGGGGGGSFRAPRKARPLRSWQQDFIDVAKVVEDYLFNYDDLLREFFGDGAWYEGTISDKMPFFNVIFSDEDVSLDELLAVKPLGITDEQVTALYNRIINSAEEDASENKIDWDSIEKMVDKSRQLDRTAIDAGYESLADRFQEAYDLCIEKYAEMSTSVCASVTLQFSQSMVMTRQAFRGTLTMFNGHETDPMTDVRLSLTVKDEDGVPVSSREFQINAETLGGFTGELDLTSGWSLEAQGTGKATMLFIPTKYAAPSVQKVYYFGGTLSYVDPFTGTEVTRTLTAVPLTVNPSPELNLTYFMQRDILGDDPLTEAVEPSEEAEFSVLVSNIGYGDAQNVRFVTQQPEIIDNEKGLNVQFEIVSSQLNGNEKTMAFGREVTTDFGTVPALGSAYAQWWLKSSILGHFTDYDVEAVHVSSYDNPDLSLLNEVSIHELIRSVRDPESNETAFLTNDIVDAADTPDMMYLLNGDKEEVGKPLSSSISAQGEDRYTLTVTPSQSGWAYGNLEDPTRGNAVLTSVTRNSDSREMPLRNFWQTDRTLVDGLDPRYENRIHFVDRYPSSTTVTYTLVFEPKPDLVLAVEEFGGVPAEGEMLSKPLTQVTVRFNKPIQAQSFTTEDISLRLQGVPLETSAIEISKVYDDEFNLDLSNLTKDNGYYVLTVQTSGIHDADGFTGETGKSVAWTQFDPLITDIDLTTDDAVGITITPIPVDDTMKVTGNFNEIISLEIVDMKGVRQLWVQNVKPGEDIDVSHLTSGIYLVGVHTDQGDSLVKLIKR